MSASVSARYAALLEAGEIERDPAQVALAARLDRLNERLASHRLARKSSQLGWIFARREKEQAPLKGLYIHGDVGRGKTMLMDLFFAVCTARRKRRAHFHEFMADVHERIYAYRQKIKSGELANGDPIARVAADIAEESWVLCFDEFHVTDIADAMILGRLFTWMFEHGGVVVATSNVAPDELYKDGLNRALFLPFIALLHKYMDVVRLAAKSDFRLDKLATVKVWHVPADAAADRALDEAWRRLALGHAGAPLELMVKGHAVHVPRAAMGVARFTFAELCERPLGAIDYLRLAREFHALVLDHVPVMELAQRNEAKRFIALIDTLYDNAVKLVASAAAEPFDLYRADDGYEVQEFRRTASRLTEMGSQEYLALPHGRRAEVTGSTEGIVET
ncbi:MAG TPA: cell division protein ZapE [Xanthobacteraceae bacterium]|nr:cell division protein ZapE [Xanthobacteraceae bacterium]